MKRDADSGEAGEPMTRSLGPLVLHAMVATLPGFALGLQVSWASRSLAIEIELGPWVWIVRVGRR
jgi:hypothetical protein